MKNIFYSLSVIIVSIFASQSFAEYAVIVNSSNSATITEKDVAKLFLAKAKSFPDGGKSTPLNQNDGSAAKSTFDENVLGKSAKQMKAYWSKLVFTGKAVPLKALSSDEEIIAHVAKNKDAIAYVSAASVTGDVKVLINF